MLARTLRYQQQMATRRLFSSSSSGDYHSLDEMYVPHNPVSFKGKLSVFDNRTVSERRYAPYELKESMFKNLMGMSGLLIWNQMYPFGIFADIGCALWMLNWAHTSYKYTGNAIRHVELHDDGKTLTMTPLVGSSFEVKTKDVKKLREEKTLVETLEESFLFPIEVSGKTYYLHGNG